MENYNNFIISHVYNLITGEGVFLNAKLSYICLNMVAAVTGELCTPTVNCQNCHLRPLLQNAPGAKMCSRIRKI